MKSGVHRTPIKPFHHNGRIYIGSTNILFAKKVEEHKEELIQLAKTLISYQTPAPPARNTEGIQSWIAGYLNELGFSIDKYTLIQHRLLSLIINAM